MHHWGMNRDRGIFNSGECADPERNRSGVESPRQMTTAASFTSPRSRSKREDGRVPPGRAGGE